MPIFAVSSKIAQLLYLVISWVTGPILVTFAQDVATILPLNIFELGQAYFYPFGMSACLKKLFCKFRIKLVAMARSLKESRIGAKIDHLRTNRGLSIIW